MEQVFQGSHLKRQKAEGWGKRGLTSCHWLEWGRFVILLTLRGIVFVSDALFCWCLTEWEFVWNYHDCVGIKSLPRLVSGLETSRWLSQSQAFFPRMVAAAVSFGFGSWLVYWIVCDGCYPGDKLITLNVSVVFLLLLDRKAVSKVTLGEVRGRFTPIQSENFAVFANLFHHSHAPVV